MIHFGQLRGGKVTIDYIYIGSKTESLYFGFENNGASSRYADAPYGGFDYDTEDGANWCFAVTNKTGNYFTIDNQLGTLSVYATDDWLGTEDKKAYGPYIGTSAQSGNYPWSKQTLHPLSYLPEKAEILQVRFKTEGLVPAGEYRSLCRSALYKPERKCDCQL